MTPFDRVKKLADKQKISIVQLEEKLGFGRNSLYSWKKKTPNGASLSKVADYFGVSTDYLLGRDVNNMVNPDNEKITLIASHVDDDVTEEEMQDILKYIDLIKRSKKNN